MKKGVKIGIGIGCGFLLILGIIILVGGYFGLNYLEKRLGESVEKFEIEGREIGKTTDNQGCMVQGFRRSASVELLDLSGSIALSSFVDACLKASKPTANFCEGVPSFWSMQDGEWAAAECQKFGLDPAETACVQVAKRKHHHCTNAP